MSQCVSVACLQAFRSACCWLLVAVRCRLKLIGSMAYRRVSLDRQTLQLCSTGTSKLSSEAALAAVRPVDTRGKCCSPRLSYCMNAVLAQTSNILLSSLNL